MFLQRTGWTSSNKIPGVTHPASKMQATYVLYVNTFDDIDIIITLICKAVHNSNVYVGGGGIFWEETGVPGGNPRVRVADHHTLLHTNTVNHWD